MTHLLLVALALALAVGAPRAQTRAAPDDVAPVDAAELLRSSIDYSKSLRSQLSGRTRARIDAFGARLVGTRWAGSFGIGEFTTRTLGSGEELLVFVLDEWRLPFVPLDAPERWLIATGVYTTSGTADVTFTTDVDGSPTRMSWLDDFEFRIVDEDTYALTPEEVDAAVAALGRALDRVWLDRERVDAARSALTSRGLAYRAIDDAEELAARLDADLRVVLQDDLAAARFVPLARPVTTWDDDGADEPADEPATPDDERRAAARDFRGGLGNVDMAREEIGYLEVRAFLPGELAGPAYAEALARLADARALIVDVRQARGGNPSGARRLASHLVEPGTPLVTVEVPARGETLAVTADELGAAPAFRERPVYVVTSRATMGAAEELAATLAGLGRATVVGEPTAGVARLTRRAMITPHVEVVLPEQRTSVTATGETWHGDGVQPDHRAGAQEAANVAWQLATEDDDG